MKGGERMAQAYYGSKISPNKTKTPEGYLILHNCPIGRAGWMQYLPHEVNGYVGDGTGLVDVERTEEDLFHPAVLASFEGKPFTNEHPASWLSPDNYSQYMKGLVKNVRRGVGDESDLMLADIIVYDPKTISEIENGKKEISSGYDYDFFNHPLHEHKFMQKNIRGNHVALVTDGRAGHRVSAKDEKAKPINKKEEKKPMKANSLLGKVLKAFAQDAEPEELAEASKLLNEKKEVEDNSFAPPQQQQPQFKPPVKSVEAEDEHDEDEEEEFFSELVNAIKEIRMEIAGIKQQLSATSATQDLDPLSKLEAELGGNEAPAEDGYSANPNENGESLTIDPNEMAEDENLPQGPTNPAISVDSKQAVLAAIKTMKPIIAKLPPEERKRASDSLSKELRKQMGIIDKPGAYSKIANPAKPKAQDSQLNIDEANRAIGEELKRKHNPHYKNK